MKKTYSINQLRDYSALFSRSEVKRMLNNDFESFNQKILRYNSTLSKSYPTYLSFLKLAYKVLETHYPNEYIYKNEFLNKWLRKELGSCNSVIFNELRVGKVIADLAMFNGISKVFEIKTILDKEARLSNQLKEYRKIFNEIYVIVPVSKLDKYLSFDDTVGIISYSHDSKIFSLVRSSVKNYSIDPMSVMQVLHTNEYLKITEQYFGSVPKCSDFEKFEVCRDLIGTIPPEILNGLFVDIMKRRKIHNQFANRITTELNQLFLSLNLDNDQKAELIQKLQSPITL